MNILITGTRGLAEALGDIYIDQSVTLISKSGGFDINNVDQWGYEFLDCDCVFNCAYDGFGQIKVLEFFFEHWKNNTEKTIVSIGSRVVSQRALGNYSSYWSYRLHKQALQLAHNAMLQDAKCNMQLINPGPIDTDMIRHVDCKKFDPAALAQTIRNIVAQPEIKNIDLWL